MPATGFTFQPNVAISMNAASVCALKCSSFYRRLCSGRRPITPGCAIVVTNAPSPTITKYWRSVRTVSGTVAGDVLMTERVQEQLTVMDSQGSETVDRHGR